MHQEIEVIALLGTCCSKKVMRGRLDQMKGCESSPTVGLRKVLRKRKWMSTGPPRPATCAWESWRATERETAGGPTRGSAAQTVDVTKTDTIGLRTGT